MIAALIDHLWQSTLFALGAGLLTLALKRNGARYRYGLWFAASVKFLIPFALLSAVGGRIVMRLHPLAQTPPGVLMVRQVVEPFAFASAPAAAIAPILAAPPVLAAPAAFNPLWILLAVWALGTAAILGVWVLRWIQIHAALRASTPLSLSVPARASPSLLEPGVVGLFRQVLMVPMGIQDHLSAAELDAILSHELCHLRRRDNLTAAIHMLVEALFWFHPLVWWIGVRLIAERERACDEGVVAAGAEPRLYAEAILKVCRFYLQSPLACAAGVSGSNLKRRIETIMSGSPGSPLGARKTLLVSAAAVLAIAAPLTAGLIAAVPAAARTAILEKVAPPPQPAPAAVTEAAPSTPQESPLAQTLAQTAETLVAPGQALAGAYVEASAAEPPLRLAVADAPQLPPAAEPAAAPPAPAAGCTLKTIATLKTDPESVVPLVGGSINDHAVKFVVAVSSNNAIFRSAAAGLGVREQVSSKVVLPDGYLGRVGVGWVHDLELNGMAPKALSDYDVHKDFQIRLVDGGDGWASSPTAILGVHFWELADEDFDLRAGAISLLRPAGCAAQDALPFNGGAYSRTKLLVPPGGRNFEYRVAVMVNGVRLEARIDTGTATTLLTRQGVARLGYSWPMPGAEPNGDLFTGGQAKIEWYKARFKTFSLGEETIQNPLIPAADVFYTDRERFTHFRRGAGRSPPPPGFDTFTPDMILGADFFRAHRVLISNSRRELLFVYNDSPIFR